MVTIYDVDQQMLLSIVSEELKKNEAIKPPEWVTYVKTGPHKERVPDMEDWWYIRVASILRRVYINPVGVQRLRVVYGGRKNRGHKPDKFRRAGGKIIRKILQQLEKTGYIKKEKNGRVITAEGQKFLDNLAFKVSKQLVKEKHKEIKVEKVLKKEMEKIKEEKKDVKIIKKSEKDGFGGSKKEKK